MAEKIFLQTFWEVYPDADVIPAFKALRNKRGEEASSRLMWYLRLKHDPEHEYVYALPKAERETLLIDYCDIKKADLNSTLFKAADEWYATKWLSKPKQGLSLMAGKVEEASAVMSKHTLYAPGDIAEHIVGVKAYKELIAEYESLYTQVRQEIKASRVARVHGKQELVRPIDNGTLYD